MADKTFKALVIEGPRKTRLAGVPRSSPGAGEVLIRVRACALCTWEQRAFSGAQQDYYPFLGGHEFAGVVEEVGPGVVESIKPGDHVSVARIERCGQCRNCRTGFDNLCKNMHKGRTPGEIFGPGGLGQYVIAPRYQVYPVSPNLPFEEASLSEPLSCVVRSITRSRLMFGESVLVIGAGVMGALHSKLAGMMGCRVIVSEPNPDRRKFALENLPAAAVIDPNDGDMPKTVKDMTSGYGADVVFITGGGEAAIAQGIKSLTSGGRLVLYAAFYPPVTAALDVNKVHHNEYEIIGTMSQSRDDFLRATEMLSSAAVSVRSLISGVYPLDKAQEAFEAALRPDTYRVIVSLD
ncbi:MAG: alcohol dehydrogenase catalytic domain-containing protein [Firmicutes bacterium]|nr:alcohol dehydrogenase catalytic domain-containing protein [Bacillota bacterium]